jgi:hypothetical protein
MKLRSLSLISVCCALIAVLTQSQLVPIRYSITMPMRVPPRTPAEYRRAPENTFLTFPEWFLVYSPDEYADFIAKQPPSDFPYLGHIGQFWQGYWAMYQATKDDYPFNADYHVMVIVIGTSTTVEYGLKWAYETTVGRVTETNARAAEDILAAKVARDYVDFLDKEPWYKFDFVGPLKRLWTDTGFWGPDPLRKWERKYFLTSEYAAKAGYAWVIKVLSESSYGVESEETAVILERWPELMDKSYFEKLKVLTKNPDGSVLVSLPRYQAFAAYARALAIHNQAEFVEIAGNRGRILVSAIVPNDFADSSFHLVMTQPILTRPGKRRIVFTVLVAELSATIRKLNGPTVHLEHIYDY